MTFPESRQPTPPVTSGHADPVPPGGPGQVPGAYPPPGPAPSSGRGIALFGGIGALVLAAVGGVFLVDWRSATTTSTLESYEPVGTVELVADGDISVRAADDDVVQVEAVARGGLSHPDYTAREEGDQLVVTHECAWFPQFPQCRGGLDVALPAGTDVVVRSSDGEVLATGLAGSLEVGTSNGNVGSSDVTGPQRLSSSNGDLTVRDAGDDVTLETSNGDVLTERVAGTVGTSASNGRITVVDAEDTVTAESSNGDVRIEGFGGDVLAETSNGDVTVVGDGEPVRLVITTGNGSETVEGPTDPDADRTVEIETGNGDSSYLAR
ncbi:hypothetical protein GCM10028784_22750 [Myceligenerans cantabricum]